jgi:Ca-activated chloride channel homolog
MNILHPQAFWFLLVIPPVIILYFMKIRRKEFKTTASFLWDRVMREARVDSFFQKLKLNLLLVLQLLFILLLISALVRPYLRAEGQLSARNIIILDISASMKTREGNRNRFDIAREKIMKILDEAPAGSAFMLITVDNSAEIRAGFTEDRAEIRKIINSLKPSDMGTKLKPALMLALSILKTHPDAYVVLVGDKSQDGSDLKAADIPGLVFIPVGSAEDNVAITDFSISRTPGSGKTELFVRVKNFGREPVNTYLEIYRDETLTEAVFMDLAPGEDKKSVFIIPKDFSGLVEARVPHDDPFPADNRAFGIIRGFDNTRVLLVSENNPFLEKALAIIPDTVTTRISPSNRASTSPEEYGVVIWNNCPVPALNRGNHVFINTGLDTAGKIQGTLNLPFIISVDEAHPVMRFMDITGISISRAEEIELFPGARVLAESDGGPLVFLSEVKNLNILYVAFDFMNSDWPLFPSFPMFFSNALEYLVGTGFHSHVDNFKTGDVLDLDLIGYDRDIKAVTPDKREEFFPASVETGKRNLILKNTGIYVIRDKEQSFRVPVNLLDAAESDIKPDPSFEIDTKTVTSAKTIPLIKEVWWELTFLALLILVLEWYVYSKRKA